jgi:putative DNA primase/helicase
LSALLNLWAHLFGTQGGYLAVFSGFRAAPATKTLTENETAFFAYPRDAEAARAAVEHEAARGREVYFCAHLLTERQRKKQYACHVHALWVDGDGAQVPPELPPPTATVESSPGREQFYWRLTRPVEPAVGEQLNKRLAYAMGGDRSGWDLTQVLRPPGTPNRKYSDLPLVRVTHLDADTAYDPDELDQVLPPLPVGSPVAEATGDPTGPPVRLAGLALQRWHGEPAPTHEDGTVDRSRALYVIGADLARYGATQRTISAALAERDRTLGWAKYTDRGDAETRYSEIAAKVLADGATVPSTPAGAPSTETPSGPRLIVRSLADVQPVPVAWLWERWLARKKVHLLGGHVGDGKSTLTAWLAALLSQGGFWPDGTTAPIGRTLFLLAEDALDDTLRPRLDQHHADVQRIDALEAVREATGSEVAFNIGHHLPLLEARIREQQTDLLIIDPLTSFLPKSDRNAEGDIRDLLTPLARLADKNGIAVLGIMHIGKPTGTHRRAVQQLLGATAFGAIARLVWMVAPTSPDPTDTRRVLAVVKSNLALRPRGLEWSRAEDAPILWHGETALNVDELLVAVPGRPRDDAEGFIYDALEDGPRLSKDLDTLAQAQGIKPATLRRAKRDLEVEAWREPGVKDPPWWCGLPGAKAAWLAAREDAQGEDAHPVEAQVSIFSPSPSPQTPAGENPSNGAKMLTGDEREHLRTNGAVGEDAHLEHLEVSIFSPATSAAAPDGLTAANDPPPGYEEHWV